MQQRDHAIRAYLGKTVDIVIDRPIGSVHNGTVYPVNYGYIPHTLTGDGEEQDVYVLGVNEPVSSLRATVIGIVRRLDDDEDKLIAVPAGLRLHQAQMSEAVHFQEQYFSHYIIALYPCSCGALVWRERENKREYLIVYESFSQCWSLPKGHMEPGESPIQTALRELKEETDLCAQLDPKHTGSFEYDLQNGGRKTVIFFTGPASGEPKPRDGEISHLKWVSQTELSDYLFPDTVKICNKLING